MTVAAQALEEDALLVMRWIAESGAMGGGVLPGEVVASIEASIHRAPSAQAREDARMALHLIQPNSINCTPSTDLGVRSLRSGYASFGSHSLQQPSGGDAGASWEAQNSSGSDIRAALLRTPHSDFYGDDTKLKWLQHDLSGGASSALQASSALGGGGGGGGGSDLDSLLHSTANHVFGASPVPDSGAALMFGSTNWMDCITAKRGNREEPRFRVGPQGPGPPEQLQPERFSIDQRIDDFMAVHGEYQVQDHVRLFLSCLRR